MARHLLVTNDYSPKTGGIQVYLHELWRRLEDGRSVVLTASSHPDALTFDASSTVTIERVTNATLFLPTFGAYRAIEAAIERHHPDLVLLDPAWPLGLLGPLLSRPYGVIVHGAEVAIPARIPLIASTLRYVLRRASLVLCAGSYPAAQVQRNAGESAPPIIEIPPGVDVARFHPIDAEERHRVRATLGFDDEDILVASYSRLVPRKGMDTLIRASATLAQRHPRLRIVIGGSGRDRARLEKLAERLKAPVTFLGRVDDDVLPNWLAASDLMVMDCRSRWWGLEQEGFGIVFVEAAASGTPQVAGRSGGSHEAVRDGETGVVVRNPRSARDLARAIDALLSDREQLATMAQNSRENALANFSWEVLAHELSMRLSPFDHFSSTNTLA
jgi:phosphatidylinositol alpha-1,6-mannosyltransferase